MAKYAINKEGAEALNQLGNSLLINANNIVETNYRLEQITMSLYDGLGIYGDEIIGIIQRNRQTLNNNRNDIINLAQQVKKQSQAVENLVEMGLEGDVSVNSESHSGIRGFFGGLFGKNDAPKNRNSVVAFGNGLWATQDKMNSERYFINGNHSDEFMNYWTHLNEFTDVETGDNSIIYINAKNIEGIYLSDQEVGDVEGFWGRRTGGTQDTFVDIARNIPKVKDLLDSGMDYRSIRSNNPELSDCVAIYFESAPFVSALNDFYVFGENGRHRELAVQSIDGIIPVRVKSIISRR